MIELGTASEGAATLETAPTRYVEGSGIRFAYRRLAWISEGANESWCSPTGARPVRVRP